MTSLEVTIGTEGREIIIRHKTNAITISPTRLDALIDTLLSAKAYLNRTDRGFRGVVYMSE